MVSRLCMKYEQLSQKQYLISFFPFSVQLCVHFYHSVKVLYHTPGNLGLDYRVWRRWAILTRLLVSLEQAPEQYVREGQSKSDFSCFLAKYTH